MPLISKPSAHAHAALIYVTVGALVMVWTAVWFAFAYNYPPHADYPYGYDDAPSFEIHALDSANVRTLVAPDAPTNEHELRLLDNGDYLLFADQLTSHVDLTGLGTYGSDETIDDCKKANVVVFGFNVNPQTPDSAVSVAEDKNLRDQSDHVRGTNYIRDLAEGTGGRYGTPSSNKLAAFLGKIVTEQSDYYVLGYTPAAGAASKNCHRLKVTVDRKGLDVEARDSYCTLGATDSLKPAEKALEARSAGGAKGSVAVSMQATWFYASRNRVVADVALDIDAAAMRMKGKLEADLPVTILAYREDGSVAARFGDTLDLMFESQARLDEFRKTPFRYSNQISLQPGTYRVRVSAGVAERAFGSAEQTLKIAPWGGETLSASAVALARTDQPFEEATAEIDSSLLVGLHRLVTKGREFLPMGGNVFRAHEAGLFYVEVYDPQLVAGAAKNAAAPVVEVSVVDRAAGARRLDSGPIDTREWVRPDSATIPISMRIPSADLTPGAYTLELRIKLAEGGDEVVRSADFEVQ